MAKSKLRQLVGLPWAADSCPWVGKLRTVLPLKNRVIRDSVIKDRVIRDIISGGDARRNARGVMVASHGRLLGQQVEGVGPSVARVCDLLLHGLRQRQQVLNPLAVLRPIHPSPVTPLRLLPPADSCERDGRRRHTSHVPKQPTNVEAAVSRRSASTPPPARVILEQPMTLRDVSPVRLLTSRSPLVPHPPAPTEVDHGSGLRQLLASHSTTRPCRVPRRTQQKGALARPRTRASPGGGNGE
jgi:hypothetical protein